jgi:hypothetical protein
LTAECRRDIAALAALQQHDNNQKETHNNVDDREQDNHDFSNAPHPD